MEFWVWLWTIVFAVSMLIFTGVSIVVSIGAIGDIKSLFRNIGREQKDEDGRSQDGSES